MGLNPLGDIRQKYKKQEKLERSLDRNKDSSNENEKRFLVEDRLETEFKSLKRKKIILYSIISIVIIIAIIAFLLFIYFY